MSILNNFIAAPKTIRCVTTARDYAIIDSFNTLIKIINDDVEENLIKTNKIIMSPLLKDEIKNATLMLVNRACLRDLISNISEVIALYNKNKIMMNILNNCRAAG